MFSIKSDNSDLSNNDEIHVKLKYTMIAFKLEGLLNVGKWKVLS